MTTESAAAIINDVAVEVGLSAVIDPFGSEDRNFKQLVTLLNTSGRDLLLMRYWQDFTEEATINVVNPGDTGDYDFPSDYDRIVPDTMWDYSEDNPVLGPATSKQWQELVADTVQLQEYLVFRIQRSQIRIFPQPPSDGKEIRYEYIRNTWVESASGDLANSCVANADTPQFEGTVMKKFLKLKWYSSKGFDTTTALSEFRYALDMYYGDEDGKGTINLSRKRAELNWTIQDSNFNL